MQIRFTSLYNLRQKNLKNFRLEVMSNDTYHNEFNKNISAVYNYFQKKTFDTFVIFSTKSKFAER
jgi:hypothetical protein